MMDIDNGIKEDGELEGQAYTMRKPGIQGLVIRGECSLSLGCYEAKKKKI